MLTDLQKQVLNPWLIEMIEKRIKKQNPMPTTDEEYETFRKQRTSKTKAHKPKLGKLPQSNYSEK